MICMRRTAATPPWGACYFPPESSWRSNSMSSLAYHLFKFGKVESSVALHQKRFGVVFPPLPRTAPCHLVVRITEIISHEETLWMQLVFGFRSYCMCPQYIILVLCGMHAHTLKPQLPSTVHIPSHAVFRYLLLLVDPSELRFSVRAATQRDAKTTTARVQSSYLRACVFPGSVQVWAPDSCAFAFPTALFFNPPNLTIKLVSHVKEKSVSLCSDVTPPPPPD